MNREIKFRGKRIDTGEWVCGDLVTRQFHQNPKYPLIFSVTKQQNSAQVPVFPDTVGQFTGLKDKNGVDIYEGDIIFLAGVGDDEVEFPFLGLYDSGFEGDIGAVLGNIHDQEATNG